MHSQMHVCMNDSWGKNDLLHYTGAFILLFGEKKENFKQFFDSFNVEDKKKCCEIISKENVEIFES